MVRNCSKTWDSRDQPLTHSCALQHDLATKRYRTKASRLNRVAAVCARGTTQTQNRRIFPAFVQQGPHGRNFCRPEFRARAEGVRLQLHLDSLLQSLCLRHLGGAIPGTPLSIHTHLAQTGGGFDRPKAFFDYNVGITAKYRNLAFDASVVGTNRRRSHVASSTLCSGAGSARRSKSARIRTTARRSRSVCFRSPPRSERPRLQGGEGRAARAARPLPVWFQRK
jgi:hypothetical protein